MSPFSSRYRFAIAAAASFFLMFQMPDWKFFKDREGNAYFIDQAGKIRVTDAVPYRYRPVSARGIDYYLHYGITLIDEHRIEEGLSVLKSILALPVDNNRVYKAQVKASERINYLKKRHGPRFSAINDSASLILIRRESAVTVTNDRMMYGFSSPDRIEVIRKRDRSGVNFRYSGILFGIGGAGAKPGGPYELLFAVDCEKFSLPLKDLSQAVEKWGENLGHDDLVREVVERSDTRLVQEFSYRGTPAYSGMEGIFINGTYSYFVRLLSSGTGYDANRKAIKDIMASFNTVSGGETR